MGEEVPFASNGTIPLHEGISGDLLMVGTIGLFPTIAAFLSVVGCLFVIVMYFRMRPTFSIFSIVFCLSIASFFSSIANIGTFFIINLADHLWLVKSEAILVAINNYPLAAAYLCSAVIAFYHLPITRRKLTMLRVILFTWMVSLVTLVPAICR